MKVLRSYSGSTMQIDVFLEPKQTAYGMANFVGLDTISVFDAKEHLKDIIPEKGRNLQIQAIVSDYVMKNAGVPTNVLGFKEPNIIQMELVRIPEKRNEAGLWGLPDGDVVDASQNCYLTDGEFIFRYLLNGDSSVVKKFNKGELTLEQLAWSKFPLTETWLEEPVFNVTHKFLKGDPYFDLSDNMAELKTSCGLIDSDIQKIWHYMRVGNAALRGYVNSLGWQLVDGKNEVSVGPNRTIKFADFSLTQDGYRINVLIDGETIKMNKQLVRDYEEWVNHDWFVDLNRCKKDKVPFSDWPDAPYLRREVSDVFAQMYKAFTASYAQPVIGELFDGKNPVSGAMSLTEIRDALVPIKDEIAECKKSYN
ncbi:MAG TPA: phosphoribosylaminoimidazolesuccinocarboxamide synthase [Candidatus Nanoarchaeia archaeon]|nr:phosphoribosylaminoimidazolesuccinocarboxamide synthase [Candidatus Nanoarchaeia archaeon]